MIPTRPSLRMRLWNRLLPLVFHIWFPAKRGAARNRARVQRLIDTGRLERLRARADRFCERTARRLVGGAHIAEVAGAPMRMWEIGAGGLDAQAPTLLYLHGGGYFSGGPGMHAAVAARIARAMGGRAFLPEYRLAPNHPFPAAYDDARAAYRWLLEREGVAPERLVVAGESAGGGLALALLAGLAGEGLPQPAALAALSPWTDLAASGASVTANAGADPFIPGHMVAVAAEYYLAGADPTDPRASPLHAEVAGLAPSLILAGSSEVLLDDAKRMAARLEGAGVPTTLEIWPKAPHAWPIFAPFFPEAGHAIARIGDFARAQLNARAEAA